MMIQAVYALDVETRKVSLIKSMRSTQAYIRDISFSHDSQLIIVGLRVGSDLCLSVHARSGHCLAHFSMGVMRGPLAFPQNRVVVIDPQQLRAMDLKTGQALGVTAPVTHQSSEGPGSKRGPLVTDPSGSKLAWLPRGTCSLLVYHAITLLPLMAMQLLTDGVALATCSPHELLWGVHGPVVLQRTGHGGQGNSVYAYHATPGRTEQPLFRHCGRDDSVRPLFSPDGAFICTMDACVPAQLIIKISDVRSGLLLLSHAIPASHVSLYSPPELWVSLRWSSCGSRLSVVLHLDSYSPGDPYALVWVLHL